MGIPEKDTNGKAENKEESGKGALDKKGDKKKDGTKKEEELSEEDLALKQNLDLLVERAQDQDSGVQKNALEMMRTEIRTATSSMTSVPKPLKFLRPHYTTLKEFYSSMKACKNKEFMADVLSVLAMTFSEGQRESLRFRLEGSSGDVGSWGHEYVRNIAGEIGEEYQQRLLSEKSVDDLMQLVQQIVPFHVKHNAEPEAVDLLMEVEKLPLLLEHVDTTNFRRTCLYLTSCASYVPEPDDSTVLRIAYDIYLKVKEYPDALRVALHLDSHDHVRRVFKECQDPLMRKQLAYILARQGFVLDLREGSMGEDTGAVELDDEERDALFALSANSRLSEGYLALARDLDVMEPKAPEDIYKAHLLDGRATPSTTVDSARQNLAATFVNAFVNAGFGQDKLMMGSGAEASSSGSGASGSSGANTSWLFKNKEHGKTSAAASLGMLLMWDVDGGLPQIDKYLYSTDNHVVAGALLSVGVLTCGVRDECDPAFALLSESVMKDDPVVRIGAIMGLGLAYANSQKEEVMELLVPVVMDSKLSMDVAGFAALTLGLVYMGTCNDEIAQAVLPALMERGETELESPFTRFCVLGLGLLFLGKQDAVDATIEVCKTLDPKISQYAQAVLESCAYAGSGNVLKVQHMLGICGDHLEAEKTPGGVGHQAASVLGIAMVAMAEELGQEMAIRSLEHLLQYGDPVIRRTVPLAMGLLSVSNPRLAVMDTLSRLSHDSDGEVAMAAILAMGLIGGGTNNARLAGMLRNLSSYYSKDANALFCVRIAQGLVHLGKGLLSLNPYHADRSLLHYVGLAGLLVMLTSCLDLKGIVLGKYHYVLYYLALTMQPRMLLTLDEDLKSLSVSVRVGQAVDVVGQAGRPKTITGFQTHSTPVLLSVGDRAELATEKYLPLSSVLEGFIVLKPNPDYVEDHLDK